MYLDIGRDNDDDYDEEPSGEYYYESHGDEKFASFR